MTVKSEAVIAQNLETLPDNDTRTITPARHRTASDRNTNYTAEVETAGIATAAVATDARDRVIVQEGVTGTLRTDVDNTARIAGEADTLSKSNRQDIIALQAGGGGGGGGDVSALTQQVADNTSKNTEQDGRLDTNEGALSTLTGRVGTAEQGIIDAVASHTGLSAATAAAQRDATTALSSAGTNMSNFANFRSGEFNPLVTRVGNVETAIGDAGTGLNDGTGLLGDVKVAKRNIEANTEEVAAVRVIAERADQREIADSTTVSDFLVRQGVTNAQDPGIDYRGTGDQDYFDANQATIPGLLQDMATGTLTIPAVNLDGVESGTRFKWTGALLFAGLRGTTTGFPPAFYYVIEQGVNRIEGAGAVDSTTDITNDWIRATGDASSFTELRSGNTVTGTDIVVRWAALYGGVDATIRPRLTAGRVDFTGQFEPVVEGIVENTVRGDLDLLGHRIDQNEGGIAANAVHRVADKQQLDAQGNLLTSIHDTLAEPQFQAIEHASVVPVDKETLDATVLNTTLGGGTAPFATILDGAIEQQTQFITRMTGANQVLSYGAGRVADVFNGHVRIFVLVPGRDASVDTPTRYFTTRDGFGTRTRPAVLEFGNGANPPRAADNEVFLTEGIPAVGAEISTISMAFAVRTNDSWAGIPNTIQFSAPRSGEVRTFPVPGVTNVVFTATALANGQIVGRVTHPGGGDPNQLVTNGGAIRFDAAYVETIRTEARDPGQTTVDGGAFTGGNIIAMDVGATGDSATATMQIVTPNGTYDSGYFRSEAHRNDFEARNAGFRAFVSNAGTPLTPAVLGQMDGTDEYLGLFARTNHHGDALQLRDSLIVPTSDGSDTYNVGDQIKMLLDIPRGTGITLDQARSQAQDVVNTSPAIQANTAKVGTTAMERANIATIPDLTQRVSANDAKPTNTQVDTRADNRIDEQLKDGGSIATYVGENAGGISQDQADDIIRNNNKISFLPENKLALDGVIAKADSHDTIFGTTLVGDWPVGGELAFLPGITELNLGDLVTQGGVVYEALVANLDNQTSADAPDRNTSAWRTYKVQTMPYDDTGLTQLINAKPSNEQVDQRADARIDASPIIQANTAKIGTTPTERQRIGTIPTLTAAVSANTAKPTNSQVDVRADNRINAQLELGGSIANYVRDNAGSGGGGGLTDEQIRDAIAGSTEAAPYNYKLKFASDTVNQVALPFLTGYDGLKSFSAVGLATGAPERNETELVIPLVNQSVPNNVLADIPFQTMPEGTITVNTENNGALYVRGILRTTHNADDPVNMFPVD
nr:hypothetical protein [Pseudomonadota bacterium]